MATQEIVGLERAIKILNANLSPRARTLALFESEVDGTRFDGRPAWTDDSVPIYERKPAIIYQAVESSIQSKLDLLLGEGRYPTVTSRPEEDEGDEDEEDGLGEEDSKRVDRLIVSISKEARLPGLFREMYESAQGCGTAIALLGSRRNRLFAETLPAKHARCERNADGDLVSVTIQYPYIDHQLVKGQWTATCMLYRRVIDANNDITYAPGVARDDGVEPVWREQSSVPHGLGFVPVRWYKHRAPRQNISGDDGNPVHKTLLGQLEAIDMALSQRHQGALTSLPQLIEIGVEPGYNPTAPGRSGSSVSVTMTGGAPGPNNPVRGEYRTQASRGTSGARKKGPNHPYQYESPDTKVSAINTPGDALAAIDAHIKDLRAKICETLAWVPLDPDSIKFAATVSGKALEILRERELNRVSRDREVFGEEVILGTIDMLLRIALKQSAQLRTPRLKRCVSVLQGMLDGEEWQTPTLSLVWPSYFMPSAEDNGKIVETACKAYDGKIATRRKQVEMCKRVLAVDNVDAYIEELEAENAERDEKETDELAASVSKMHAGLTNDPNARGRGKNPAANAQGRSGGAASAIGNPAKANPKQSSREGKD